MKVLKRSGILIPKDYSNKESYVRIKEHLSRRTRAYNTSTYTINTFYLESEKFLLIPRNFPLHKFTFDLQVENHQHEGQDIEIKHKITPRNEVQKRAINYLMTHDNGVIELAPGVGKTVITIYMIAERKKKSLILVHRDSLADQWRDRAVTFTNLQDDDIARLTSSTFEEDFKKPIIISTVQTFISLLKRNRKEFLIALNEANIGIFVADEVHTSVGAPTFSECSIHVPAKYTYGLSATPYRFDGNGDIIRYHLGEIFSDEDSEGTMKAKVTVVLIDYQIDSAKSAMYIRWGGSFQRARYLNQMKKSKPFMAAIKSLLKALSKDRNILCMVERIKLIDELYDWMKHPSKSKFCGSAKLDTLEQQITFTTPGKCRDGVDAPWKDTVIMTSPISNINQLTGRVVRTDKNKKRPAIIDMVDYGCDDMKQSFNSRKAFYEKKGWEVQYAIYVNNKLSMIDEDVATDILLGVG